MFWRATQGPRLVGEKGRIVHEHGSVPVDWKTGTVSFSLKL